MIQWMSFYTVRRNFSHFFKGENLLKIAQLKKNNSVSNFATEYLSNIIAQSDDPNIASGNWDLISVQYLQKACKHNYTFTFWQLIKKRSITMLLSVIENQEMNDIKIEIR